MNSGLLLDLWRDALGVLVALSAPFLITGLVVGLVVAVASTVLSIVTTFDAALIADT